MPDKYYYFATNMYSDEFHWLAKSLGILLTIVTTGIAAPQLHDSSQGGDTPVSTSNAGHDELTALCPDMVRHVFEYAIPHDESKAGVFEKYSTTEDISARVEMDLRSCVEACCEKRRNNTCNVVFMFKHTCYHVRCVSNKACLPKEVGTTAEHMQMVLVNSVRQSDGDKVTKSWLDSLKAANIFRKKMHLEERNENRNFLRFWKQLYKFLYYRRFSAESGNFDKSDFPTATSLNEIDIILPKDLTSYYRADTPTLPNYLTCSLESTSGTNTRCSLNEKCVSAEINVSTGICKCNRGFVRNHLQVCVPDSVEYILLDAPSNEKRINHVPQVIITPSKQYIRQPTANAILDGSTSTDDDKIVLWHWEVVSSPMGYQPKLSQVNSLHLTDLTSSGNYTFKLTVMNSDYVSNFTTATIIVFQATDYPPTANAGNSVVLHLPNNSLTLNGTASSDDQGIVAWEWTKDARDEMKVVDMQNTKTPCVQLSNLEVGIYTFVLKVTDAKGQFHTDRVQVFVKP